MKARISPPRLTTNARLVLESRYLLRNEKGVIIETPLEMFERVAKAVARAEKRDRAQWENRFLEMMTSLRFLPNSPTLMNAGIDGGQLSACYVLPIGDSLDGIFRTLQDAAIIHQSGGGTGFSFSNIRARGSLVQSTFGAASGPVAFMKIFDATTDAIKQGGKRRGANMAVLRVDHPDIEEFIDSKRDMLSITNFNISVGVTDTFMRAADAGEMFDLRDPLSHVMVRQVDAAGLLNRIAQMAWECGDPGLVFLDRINLFNPTPRVGVMESTNPCGEQPLLPYESCNLGSLDLGKYHGEGDFDWDKFRQDIHLAVRFLDNVIDVNAFPVEACRKITLRNRKVGLGVMGFADLLLEQGIPYDTSEARQVGERLMSFLDYEAKRASADLAVKRGAFPNWRGSLWHRLGMRPLRNATVSTVAPTGTISIIAGCSSGIEPIFAGAYFRNVLNGQRLLELHPAVSRTLASTGVVPESLNDLEIAQRLGSAWCPARRVSVEDHVGMQAVFQRFSDSAVSKTVNPPESATVGDVRRAYGLAYRSGCKGITVYRDRSRPAQVLETSRPAPASGESCPTC